MDTERTDAAVARVIISAMLLAGSFGAATQASADPASDVRPGDFVVLRDVAPRNAIMPGTGQPYTVGVQPPSEVFGPLATLGPQISDEMAADIQGSGRGALSNGASSLGLDVLTGTRESGNINGRAEQGGGGGGLGNSISGAITGALGSALGALGGSRQ